MAVDPMESPRRPISYPVKSPVCVHFLISLRKLSPGPHVGPGQARIILQNVICHPVPWSACWPAFPGPRIPCCHFAGSSASPCPQGNLPFSSLWSITFPCLVRCRPPIPCATFLVYRLCGNCGLADRGFCFIVSTLQFP